MHCYNIFNKIRALKGFQVQKAFFQAEVHPRRQHEVQLCFKLIWCSQVATHNVIFTLNDPLVFSYVHVSGRNQAATGRTWFDCGDLHVNRRRLLGVRHLFNFVCKTNQLVTRDRGQEWRHRALATDLTGQMQATHSVIHSEPSLCFHTELWMELKQKTFETLFWGVGRVGDWWNASVMSSLGSRASSFQTADSATSSNSQACSLVNVKWAMDVKACQFCHYLSLYFFRIIFTVPAAGERYWQQIWQNWASLWCVMMPSNRVQLNSEKLHASPDLWLCHLPNYNRLGWRKLPCIRGEIT